MKMLVVFTLALPLAAADGRVLFNGKNLDGWDVIGNGVWIVMADGTLLGERRPMKADPFPDLPSFTRAQYRGWRDQQGWLYTKQDYGAFDLHLEFWTRIAGNSGISIRDSSRAKYAITIPPDYTRTPSKIGYEIQINNQYEDPHPTGSIYGFMDAKVGAQKDNEWNALDIESRDDLIRIKLNGQTVAEHAGDPAGPKTGPIGLQLHDQFSVIMFRNIRLK